jgi:tRNA threonylcarbamoyladenosine biosynthesis protein TsaE
MELTVLLHSLSDTDRLGRALAAGLPADAVCLLGGGLAAGKTTLVKSICAGLGIDPRLVISPTYTIANWYEGAAPVCHVDFYRLEDSGAVYDMDPDDWLNRHGPTFIEWPEVARPFLDGVATLRLDIATHPEGGDEARRVVLSSDSPAYGAAFAAVAQAFGQGSPAC